MGEGVDRREREEKGGKWVREREGERKRERGVLDMLL